MLTASRNVRPTVASDTFHADFRRHHDDVVSAYVFAGQARRFSEDGSVFSFDDYDFGCPLKLKESTSAVVPPPTSLTRSLSWSSFDGGHIFDRYDMPDDDGPTGSPATSGEARRSPNAKDTTTQNASKGTARRSRRRGPAGSFTSSATKAKPSSSSPCSADNDDDEAVMKQFQELITSNYFETTFDRSPKKSADGLNVSSHSTSSRQRRGGDTTNFDYLPKAQRASLHKSASLRNMRREGSQRSLVSAAASKTGTGRTQQPRGRLIDSSHHGTMTTDRSRARSRSLGAAPARPGARRSLARRSRALPASTSRSSPVPRKDDLESSHSSFGSVHEEPKSRPSPRRRQSPRGEDDLAALWKDLNIPLAPTADSQASKGPREVPDLEGIFDGLHISLGPTAAATTRTTAKSTKMALSSGSDHQSSRRASSRRPSHRLTTSRRPAAVPTVA